MNRVFSFVLFFLIVPFTIIAQKKEYNALLWRISGHGLTTPSYLYGTMHLTDKRLFNFPDSLYHSLENSEGFAAEVDMGDFMPQMIREFNDDTDKYMLIKNLVRPELIAPYREKLSKRFNKKFEKITWGELKALRSKLSSDLIRKGEMSTIMDVYLFDIAKKQGKWVGGIEDYEDQLKTNKEDDVMSAVDEILTEKKIVDEKVEWMINVYLNQQLDTIDVTNELWQGTENNALIRRNKKMARRIDSIMQLRTCLFAIGAAHIPGDSGVVRLLRERGFTVEPVSFSKRIEAGKYIYVSKDLPWVNAEIKDKWYALQMPGKSEQIKTGEDIPGFISQVYFDLSKMNAYFSFGFPVEKEKQKNADSIFSKVAENFGKKGKIISSKSVSINGTTGKEYVIKSGDNDIRLQAFLPPAGVVVNMMSSYKSDSLFGADARHFFESFHVLKEPVATTQPSWQTYSFPHHAFSVKFPAPFKKQDRLEPIDSAWKTSYYVSNGKDDKLSCWMMVMEAKKGYYSDSDTAYFSLLQNRLKENFSKKAEVTQWSKQTVFNDYPAFEIVQRMKYKGGYMLKLKGKVIDRGNRRYYFYVVFEDNKEFEGQADEYMNSFTFLSLPQLNWGYHDSPLKDISIWSPAAPEYLHSRDSTSSIRNYIIYDSAAPSSILIYKQYLSPYSWWESDSAFFTQQSHLYSTAKDSIKDLIFTRKGEIAEADFHVNLTDNHLIEKVHFLLNGDSLYIVLAALPAAAVKDDNYNRLFSSIKFTQIKKAGVHLQHKTDRILKDLTEGDSATFAAALESLNAASFTTEDLPKLHKGILQAYRDFDSTNDGAHSRLIEKILAIDSGSTFSFIKNNYSSLTGDREKLKYSFLYCLLGLKSKEAFSLFKEIVTKELPKAGSAESLRFALNDSLALTAAIFPEILPASKDTAFIKMLPFVANRLMDSGQISKSLFDPYKENFYTFTRREIDRLKKEEPDYDYTAAQLIEFLTWLNDPVSHKLLSQFLAMPGLSIKERAAVALLKCGQKVDPMQLENIAKDNFYRLTLYEDLEELKKQNLFPAKYYTQQLFAQSDIFQSASDDYEPTAVTFIGVKTALFMGKQKRFYLFKVTYDYEEGEQETYLGVAGPYSIQPGKIITRSQVGGLYQDKAYDPAKVNAQFKDYLKQMEEYLKENNE